MIQVSRFEVPPLITGRQKAVSHEVEVHLIIDESLENLVRLEGLVLDSRLVVTKSLDDDPLLLVGEKLDLHRVGRQE